MTHLTSSIASGATEPALIDDTIGRHIERMATRHADRDALISCHQGLRYTYAQLNRSADRLASALLRQGVAPGERVAIWAHNSAEWLLMQIATAKAGIILVNINPAYRVAELDYALNKVGCRMLVTMMSHKTSDYMAMVRQLAPELAHCKPGALAAARAPDLKTVVYLDHGATPDQPQQADQPEQPGMLSFTALMASGDPDDPLLEHAAAAVKPGDPVNIQFTSGTTGFPKGATLTHRNILNNGYFIGEAMRLTEHDRLCIPVPLYHCFGMVLGNLACLTHGAAIVYPNGGFDPLTVLETVQQERCTGLHGVPTMFIAVLAHPRFAEFDLGSLRTGIMAGSPCPINVMRQVVERMHMAEVTIAYGMTETSPVSCQSSTSTPLDKRVATVGTVQPHLSVKIVDPDSGDIVAPGVTGELCTLGYSVMHGYWNDPDKTAEAIDTDGWMHTGDLATMDSEGYVSIVGRIKDMVIRGGENIYPREIEEYLYRHPDVSDVQVIGVPDARYGEELCAWIIVKTGHTASEESIRAFCRDQIAHHKIPRHIRFVDAFPMTITGKVQKFAMRDAMRAELGDGAGNG